MTRLGATPLPDGRCRFLVWAPRAERVELVLQMPARRVAMERDARGHFEAVADTVPQGTAYGFRLDGGPLRPDPASRLQRDTVHGPSVVFDPSAHEADRGDWRGIPLETAVFYELHVGTFTPEGTLDAAIARLPYLRELGITAVEPMPVAQFPGGRNWGYDGVLPFAVQNTYGGPAALKRFVAACHRLGLAVVLDVVYNHLGPEGNYLAEFGPYFSAHHKTPWGEAINFDGAGSDEVRRFFIESALFWIETFGVDGLRLDAIHGIVDTSARPFLQELAETVRERAGRLGREVWLIAESDLNDPRVVRSTGAGGLGLDGQWCDDFHHALHALVTGESRGYYRDFGGIEPLQKAYREGFVLDGAHSGYRGRRHGAPARDVDPRRFVVFAQNHDQVGNRKDGDRLSTHVSFDILKVVAAATILSPYLPLLFMGEEYGESAPFPYFVSHGDRALVEAVRKGRAEEFAAFGSEGSFPDPQDQATFDSARIPPQAAASGRARNLFEWHKALLALRREEPALGPGPRLGFDAEIVSGAEAIALRRERNAERSVVVLNFGPAAVSVPLGKGTWRLVLDSADRRWGGEGGLGVAGTHAEVGPRACAVFLSTQNREGS